MWGSDMRGSTVIGCNRGNMCTFSPLCIIVFLSVSEYG